jgi:hypothetical protein
LLTYLEAPVSYTEAVDAGDPDPQPKVIRLGQCQTCFALVRLDNFTAELKCGEHTEWHASRDRQVRVAAMGFGL